MAEKMKGGLGTGLGALFGETEDEAKQKEPVILPISRVEPREGQPRRGFDEQSLSELTDSIREYGVIQPITVRPLDNGYYQIIAGERRWRAARAAGLAVVPVRVVEADDRRATELALVENLQREDLSPIEEAQGFQRLMTDFGLTQEEVSSRVLKSRPSVANALRLLKLPAPLLAMVEDGTLTAGHARALLPLGKTETQFAAARRVTLEKLSVRQTEALVARLMKKAAQGKEASPVVSVNYVKEAERRLSDALGRGVRLTGGQSKGFIRLEFYSADDRELLMEALLRMKRPCRE